MEAPENKNGSTGPKTPEGKARSSQNALKHGFTSKNTIIPPGMEEEFDQLVEGYANDIRPAGAIEETLFRQLVRSAWNIKRIEIRQAELASDDYDPLTAPDNKEFDRLERYHARYQGNLRSTLRELRALQTSRFIQKTIPEPLGSGSFPVTVKVSEIVQLAKRSHPRYSTISINHLQAEIGKEREAAKRENTIQALNQTPGSFKDHLTEEEKKLF
jgi:hypothetical protein